MPITNPPTPTSWQGIVTAKDVTAKFRRSLPALLRAAKQGQFPAPIQLSGKHYWVAEELNCWLETQRKKVISKLSHEGSTSSGEGADGAGDNSMVLATTGGEE